MARTILGPKLDQFTLARAAVLAGALGVQVAAASAKSDPIPAFRGLDLGSDPIRAQFEVAPSDPATENKLIAITVVVVPVGHGEPTAPEDWLACSYAKGATDTAALEAGGPVDVVVADLPDGDFTGQVLLTYDA